MPSRIGRSSVTAPQCGPIVLVMFLWISSLPMVRFEVVIECQRPWVKCGLVDAGRWVVLAFRVLAFISAHFLSIVSYSQIWNWLLKSTSIRNLLVLPYCRWGGSSLPAFCTILVGDIGVNIVCFLHVVMIFACSACYWPGTSFPLLPSVRIASEHQVFSYTSQLNYSMAGCLTSATEM